MPDKIHSSVTVDRVMAAVETSTFGDEMIGICLECGSDQSPVEPDARNYNCEACGAKRVFGAEELLMRMVG
jgi:hypothetical protein